jgi:hypothetical protein
MKLLRPVRASQGCGSTRARRPRPFASPNLLERLIAYKPPAGIDAGVMAFVCWHRGYYWV